MTDPDTNRPEATNEASGSERPPISAKERARRRRAAELLGDILPKLSPDQTDVGWNEKGGTSREEQFLRDVPPHHV